MNPLCAKNDGIEDMERYLLFCYAYDADRRDHLRNVNAMLLLHGLISLSNEELLKVILYSHEQLSFDSNVKILKAMLEYIQASKRSNNSERKTCNSLF